MKKITLLSVILGSMQAMTAQNAIDSYLTGNPKYVTIATATNKLASPRDLDFKPDASGALTYEMWVVNNGTASVPGSGMVMIFNVGRSNQLSRYRRDSNANHFLRNGPAIAFGLTDFNGKPGGNVLWANAIEGNNGGDNFTGASLWPSDTNIYAKIHQNDNYLGSHCDMLHQSPYSMGIAHEKGNAFWLFDGYAGNICRYDFAVPHGYGEDDHSDGMIRRYSDVKVVRKPNVPSHLILDKATGWLYIADTGNKRVIRMDINTGAMVAKLTPKNEPLASFQQWGNATQEVVASTGLTDPCGIEFYQGRLMVSDNATGDIVVYDVTVKPAVEKGRIKTGVVGIMGLKVGPDDRIYFVDNKGNKIVRIDPGSPTAIDEQANKLEFTVFPNPASESFNVTYSLEKSQHGTLQILDAQGRMVDNIAVEGNSGVNQVELDSKSYPAGMYFIKLTFGKESTFKKLSVL